MRGRSTKMKESLHFRREEDLKFCFPSVKTHALKHFLLFKQWFRPQSHTCTVLHASFKGNFSCC